MSRVSTSSVPEVPHEKLRWQCEPESLRGDTTDDLVPLEAIVGQERALKSLVFGLDVTQGGFNLYVCGSAGVGKMTAIQQTLSQHQEQPVTLFDCCYVHAFHNPEQPRVLMLPAGQGRLLKQAMEELLGRLKRDIPRVLNGAECQHRKAQLFHRFRRREERLFSQFEARLAPHFGLLWHDTDTRLPEVALRLEGRLVTMAEIEERVEKGRFPVAHYRQLHSQQSVFLEEFASILANITQLHDRAQDEMQTLERALVRPLIHQALADLGKTFSEPAVQQYLAEVEEALYKESGRFHPALPEKEMGTALPFSSTVYEDDPYHEYQVNVLIDHTVSTAPPVIFEAAPTYKNLFGTIEPTIEHSGVWRSDFMGIRAGSLQRANGGYLIFNALDAFADPNVWPALKRILRYGQADIQAGEQAAQSTSIALKPEPIPCQVKVIMVGDEDLYQTLVAEDEQFTRLFKVKADFAPTMPRHPDTLLQYARFMAHVCRQEPLRPVERAAMAAVIEWSVRLAGRQNKLSARLGLVADVLREADYWAGMAHETHITRAAVERALYERAARVNLMADMFHEAVAEGLLLIATRGAVIGQVNGLSVYDITDDYAFGCPMRITATTAMGSAGVVNIEREANLSDATHNKGVLILNGYLHRMYAQDKPLILSASLCIEQSYEGIMGDSASAAEVYALLSSLAACPIDQGIAVTGSVNQRGDIQPISGINEKIEGFFDICRQQGLTGTQGVLLPVQNVDDLMLRQDVCTAITSGQFHLYPLASIDDGLPLLMGLSAGKRRPPEGYDPDTINGRVDAQLRYFTEQWFALQNGRSLTPGLEIL